MLRTRAIPIHDDDRPDDWHTFLYKAAKGSIKAPETVAYSNMAYMVALTGDPTCPDTMHLDDYGVVVRERFPTCPIPDIQAFRDMAVECNWVKAAFRVTEIPRNPAPHYVSLWGRRPVSESALMNDAMLYCLANWSADNFLECVDHYGAEYDSLLVTVAMLAALKAPTGPLPVQGL